MIDSNVYEILNYSVNNKEVGRIERKEVKICWA